jgi:hypothetical protein
MTVKVNIIDNKRNMLLETIECVKEPKVGESYRLSSGEIVTFSKVRKNVNKNLIEGFIELPLKHKTWPKSRGPFDK